MKKEFDWDGRRYVEGDVIEIPEEHPRVGAMVSARFITYDPTLPSEDDRFGRPIQELDEELAASAPKRKK